MSMSHSETLHPSHHHHLANPPILLHHNFWLNQYLMFYVIMTMQYYFLLSYRYRVIIFPFLYNFFLYLIITLYYCFFRFLFVCCEPILPTSSIASQDSFPQSQTSYIICYFFFTWRSSPEPSIVLLKSRLVDHQGCSRVAAQVSAWYFPSLSFWEFPLLSGFCIVFFLGLPHHLL